MKIPSRSATKTGHEDEGISSVLGKPINFKYTDRFFKWWYTKMGMENNLTIDPFCKTCKHRHGTTYDTCPEERLENNRLINCNLYEKVD